VLLMSIFYPKSAPGLPPEAIGYREPNGARGVWQLGILVVFSGLVGYYVLSQTGTRAGADFVILTICVATVVALICALMNKMLGAQRITISAVLTAALLGLYAYLHQQGNENLALTMEMAAAGAIYALVVGLIERLTGFRLMSRMAEQVTFVMVPPLLLIFLVLGTIFIGLATPTEGGAMGALGSVILAAVKRRLDNNPNRFNFTIVRQATEATAKLSAFVLFILIGARVFSLTFYGVNGHVWVEHLLTSLPGGQVGFLIVVNALVFFLAFFLDFFELAFIVVPLLGPAAEKLGIDLIWFGVMLGVNMQTSFMHPPFGFALFFLRSVAPKTTYTDRVTGKRMEPVTTGQIYWGAIPFVVIQLIMVAIVVLFPNIVMHYKAAGPAVDPAAVQKKLDELLVPGLGAPGDPGGLPGLNFDEPPKIQ
jgi:TRAP-type mannitol/chloroaromatic compound transport system permease large subunit